MYRRINYIPFKLGGCFTKLYDGSRDKFKGIPDFLTPENSIIKTIYFGTNSSFNNIFYLVIGDESNKKRICIIDGNCNHDFSDDYKYIFDIDSAQKGINFLSQAMLFRYTKNENIEKNLYLKPKFFSNNMKFSNATEQKYFVTFELGEYLLGSFSFKDERYKVVAAMPTPRFSYDSETVVSIVNQKDEFPLSTRDINFHKIGESVILGNEKFNITNISPVGDSLYINYSGTKNLKEFGYQVGLHSLPIIGNTLTGTFFNLANHKNKFVLVDFWGTWCVPCIKLIPMLRKLKKEYKNLTLISVACEDKEPGAVKRIVEKYKMNWINLYEPFKGNQNLIKSFKIKSFPTTLLIDPNGMIIFRGSAENFELLEELLKEKSDKK